MPIAIQKLREATRPRRDDRCSQNGGFQRNDAEWFVDGWNDGDVSVSHQRS